MKAFILAFLLFLPACGILPSIDAGDNAKIGSSASGSSVATDNIGSYESTVENTGGIPAHWFIIGGILFGIIIPQPRIIRWLF